MKVEEIFFSLFRFFGYQKMQNVKNKPKTEIALILFAIGLIVLRSIISIAVLNSGNVDAMRIALYLNLIPVIQTMFVLWRKYLELERKRKNRFNGIYKAANASKEANPFLRRMILSLLFLTATIVSPILYLCCYSTVGIVESFSLQLSVVLYMVLVAVDGIFEQAITLFSVDV